ncbi:hypothetical protein BH11PSE11_BH11PSE11_18330 [soil metagenome]
MEIIFEVLLQIVWWVLQFIGELLLQLIIECGVEWIGHGVKEKFRDRRPIHPALTGVAYLILGALAGAFSLWLVPEVFIREYWLRIANLLLTPFAAGLFMASIGAFRRRHDKDVIRLETFAYGFFFALAMASVRFFFGR